MRDDGVIDYDVGDKVVCVDGKFFEGAKRIYKELPVELQTYVVRELRVGVALEPLLRKKVRTGEVSVLLVGVTNPPQGGRSKVEPGFAHWRFVKLEEFQGFADKVEAAMDEAKKPEALASTTDGNV